MWLAISLNSTNNLAYSYDGITWTAITGQTLGTNKIIWYANKWISSTGAYSSDGFTWTSTGVTGFTINAADMTCSSGLALAMANGQMIYSYNGLTWTTNTSQPSISAAIYNGSIWVAGTWAPAASGHSTLLYSYDGLTWTDSATSNTIFPQGAYTAASGFAWNGTVFVALVGPTSNVLGYSYDGIVWYASTNGNSVISGAGNQVGNVVYNGRYFVVLGTDSPNLLGYSADGIIWTSSSSGNTLFTSTSGVDIASKNVLPLLPSADVQSPASYVVYTPGNSAHWNGSPTTAQGAIDRLAAKVYALSGNVAIP